MRESDVRLLRADLRRPVRNTRERGLPVRRVRVKTRLLVLPPHWGPYPFRAKGVFNTGDALSIPKKLVSRVNRAFISHFYSTACKIAGGLLSFHSGRA